ncbi:hypothetical protein E2K98_20670 [Bacillus salipaludis]|uniref:Uncharacterized protein n=1 Tax=Bacillus salipaludis TaxID=2547811 RepID=A0A4V3ATA9_9BACI|nr:hypothetical protein [Bacillus salipaludis]TDK59117.1 hypothetical protein E2K98_20670 [Bacillus salipaludis]
MKQFIYGLLLYITLMIPPVAHFLESIMIVHMHMQMPLLVFSGFLMARLFQIKFPRFFEKWNGNGIPGIMLFLIVAVYWTIPKTMDETLTIQSAEIFKFISLPFIGGISLRDSWKKLSVMGKNTVIIIFTVKYFGMGLLYIETPVQVCNNYLIIDQLTLGWGFLTTAICLVIYLIYTAVIDRSKYE